MSNKPDTVEEYWGIYNRYNALNESGMDIAGECQAAIKAVMDKYHQYNPRDVAQLLTEIAGAEAGHRIILRANKMRKLEKEKKKQLDALNELKG